MLFNKKSMLTLFAGAALLSASALNGVSAFADGGGTSGGSTTSSSNDTPGKGPSIYKDGQNVSRGFDFGNSKLNQGAGDKKFATVSGYSDAHVRVVQGYLVLETVPSLGFKDVAQSNSKDHSAEFQDNKTVLNTDSFWNNQNQPQTLEVLDARGSDATPSTQNDGGYNVSASLGNFATYDSNTGQASSTPVATNNGFSLNLAGKIQKNDDNYRSNTGNVSLNPGKSNNVLSNNTIGSGTTDVNFNNGSNLTVPANTPGGQYAAPITWTLAPTADGQNVNGQ